MIRVALLKDGKIIQGGIDLITDWSRERKSPIWVDIGGGTQEEIEPLLEKNFGFHQLAAEDALSENALPKYDRFDGYDFLVFRALNFNVEDHAIESIKMACFLGDMFVFTIHAQEIAAVDAIWQRCPLDQRIMERGPDFVLYSVLDLLVDYHFPILDQIEDRIDEIHDLVFSTPSQAQLDELLHLKRDLNIIRRYTIPQRELFNLLSRGDAPRIKREHLIYYRDIYDHMFRIGESIDVERDLASSTMEAYLSVIANRTNEIMKALTMFSAILLPINFIASIYGMNFESIPELRWKYGHWFAFSMMAVVAAFVCVYFVRKGWLWPSRRAFLQHERQIRKTLRRRGRPGIAVSIPTRITPEEARKKERDDRRRFARAAKAAQNK